MKLYIKANSLKVLKNLDTLLPVSLSKAFLFVDENSNIEYRANLLGAKEILKNKHIFYEDKEIKKLIKGVYFGNSYCEHLLPSQLEIAQAFSMYSDKHHNFVFVYPAISSAMEYAKEIALNLKELGVKEVVANDFGMLKFLLDSGFKVILGTNFTKTVKNAFLQSKTPLELTKEQLQNQKELLSYLEFETKSLREFYKSLGVGRFGVENLDINFDFLEQKSAMHIDIYYPFITISNSRACDIAGTFEDERGYFAHDNCPKYCNQVSLEFANSEVLGLYQRYNSIFKTAISLNLPKEVYKNSRNRLIWEVFL